MAQRCFAEQVRGAGVTAELMMVTLSGETRGERGGYGRWK
jgi:hypothetical protein